MGVSGGKATGASPPAQSTILVAMDRWTSEQRGFSVKAYYENGGSSVQARRAFRRHFIIPRNQSVPTDNALRIWVNNLEETGSTSKKRGGSVKTVRTHENIAAVREALVRSPRRSARQHWNK